MGFSLNAAQNSTSVANSKLSGNNGMMGGGVDTVSAGPLWVAGAIALVLIVSVLPTTKKRKKR